jgi:hypothetical protein
MIQFVRILNALLIRKRNQLDQLIIMKGIGKNIIINQAEINNAELAINN